MNEESDRVVIFRGKGIRSRFHDGEWWFVVEDVVLAMAETSDPGDYMKKLRRRDPKFSDLWKHGDDSKGGDKLSPPLELVFNTGGGRQKIKCWNAEGIFRLIQSIPSKKVEPLKRWLSRVGYERLQDIKNPEFAQKRITAICGIKVVKNLCPCNQTNDFELLFKILP